MKMIGKKIEREGTRYSKSIRRIIIKDQINITVFAAYEIRKSIVVYIKLTVPFQSAWYTSPYEPSQDNEKKKLVSSPGKMSL